MPQVNKPSLSSKLAGVKAVRKRAEPLWRGPEEDGITQSLLSRFMVCRERFRLLVCEGLRRDEGFSRTLEYGNMWHICEENLAANRDWRAALKSYATGLVRQYPLQQEEAIHWYRVCLLQFPVYVKYWEEHADVTERTPIYQELSFGVPYVLPSGRTVTLRGKFDAVDLIGKGKAAGVYLQENKTKGDIDELQLQRQLRFDLQTMFYLTALRLHFGDFHRTRWDKYPIRGVRYNVIRRPLSGGKGSIRRHQPTKGNPKGESADEFYNRLLTDYVEAEPEYFFMRWKVDISQIEIERFQKICLNPWLEMLCDWWEYVKENPDPFNPSEVWDCDMRVTPVNRFNAVLPFGIYNVIAEGGSTDLDEYLANGSEVGLNRVSDLFPELR